MAYGLRPATLADMDRLLDLVAALQDAIAHPIPMDRAHTAAVLELLIGSDDGLVLLAGDGFIAGQVVATAVSPRRVAIEHGWYARDGSGRALLAAYEAWAAERGAVVISVRLPPGARVLRGYAPVETTWMRRA